MDSTLISHCDDLSRAIDRLAAISAHDALILLRASFSAPKLQHTLRSAPCAGHPTLGKFDDLLRGSISTITDTDLTDVQWIQASLPVKNGGLGIRRVASLAPSAFLASAAGTRDLQDGIFRGFLPTTDTASHRILKLWIERHNTACPVGHATTKQKLWDKPCIDADMSKLISSLPEPRDRARLLALSAPHSGDWLHALRASDLILRPSTRRRGDQSRCWSAPGSQAV